MKVVPFVPALTPFTFHWYKGAAPSFTGYPVNVTEVPRQKGLTGVEMEILTGIIVRTTMLILLDIAGLPLLHKALDVNTQTTTSPFAGVKVYVGLLVPTFRQFTFH